MSIKARNFRVYHKDSNSMEYGYDLVTISQYLNKFADEYIEKNIFIDEFTGYQDANDKYIYENDILQDATRSDILQVRCEAYPDNEGYNTTDHHGWVCYDLGRQYWGSTLPDFKGRIIGNIHENPELNPIKRLRN